MSSTLPPKDPSVLFGRVASLVVADATGRGLDLSQLQFSFHVSHPSIQTPQLLQVRIYNLSATTANLIQQEFTQVQLTAGYQANNGVIFSGSIAQIKLGRESATDSYVEIFAQNSDVGYNFAQVNQTLSKGYTHSDVCKVIGTSFEGMSISLGTLPPFPPSKFPRGKTMYGLSRDYARSLAMTTGMHWNIDGEIFRMLQSRGPSDTQAVILTPDSGLLGIPEQTVDGISIECLLNPKLKIDSMITLETTPVNQATLNFDYTAVNFLPKIAGSGTYRVLWIEHYGDTRGDDWNTSLNCLDPNAPAPITPGVLGVGFYGPA